MQVQATLQMVLQWWSWSGMALIRRVWVDSGPHRLDAHCATMSEIHPDPPSVGNVS